MVWSSLFWANWGLGLSGHQQVVSEPSSSIQVPASADKQRPNIVFILTDDQDLHLDSLDYMPFVQKHLLNQGTFYKRHFCTIALCCPSRVSLWTGKAAHNTNVTDVSPPYGGFPKFVSQGLNDNFLPIWLQEAGYNTYYTGKLFNAHTIENYHSPFVNGFTGSDFLLDPFTYQYLNSSYQRNRDPPVRYEGEHSVDVLAEKAYGFLNDAVKEEKPFFLTLAPVAPHSNLKIESASDSPGHDLVAKMSAPIPAARHAHLFEGVKVPRTENFNPEKPSGASWIKKLPRQTEENVEYNDGFYRARLQALQGVDEIVDGIVQRLEEHGILDNTYIIYSADNGYHIGQHRLQPGKECGYEEDINIPLIIRGPGVPKNSTTEIVTTHTDLAPTFLDLIGAPLRADFDGEVIPTSTSELREAEFNRHEHVNVEYWGFGLAEGKNWGGDQWFWNNTYKALRVIGKDYNLYYSVWCSNEHELYDLNKDPGQLNNLLETSAPSFKVIGHALDSVASRLDALLFVLKSCKGRTCIEPWRALHPEGNVNNLHDALSPRFDRFYEVQQKKIEYSRCEAGYIVDAEGPQFEKDGLVYRHNSRWSDWV
ncbi:Arylsulphatase [Corynespora cassiicola Philippines]|uniref:Arylsulfatase n=1 Tax=Corynespora cassiicola Philippines TaxID=1448308 RepID=A0A2T2P355_CORCC|nr:Arylsulphatase [Corynespora cassiicola Philippines]